MQPVSSALEEQCFLLEKPGHVLRQLNLSAMDEPQVVFRRFTDALKKNSSLQSLSLEGPLLCIACLLPCFPACFPASLLASLLYLLASSLLSVLLHFLLVLILPAAQTMSSTRLAPAWRSSCPPKRTSGAI